MEQRAADARLLGGTFLEGELAEADEWLGRYFGEGPQRSFLSWYAQLRGILEDPGFRGRAGHKRLHACFEDHTGTRVSERWVYKMLDRLMQLEDVMGLASQAGDIQLVAKIKSGQWRVTGSRSSSGS